MSRHVSADLEGELIAAELTPSENIEGDDEEDTALLQKMWEEAWRYISSFAWCKSAIASYFGGGVGGIFAVFFFRIQPGRTGVDPWIWVMVGDVPSAYLPVTDCKSPGEAFRTYIRGMKKWVELARQGKEGTPEQGVPPVNVPATPEWAEQLDKRLQMLEFVISPFFEGGADAIH